MASFLSFIFGLCLSGPGKPEQNDEPTDDNIVTEDLYFVVPQKDYEKFVQIQPSDSNLSIGQFMFLFYYLCGETDCVQQGHDSERVEYSFNDTNRIFSLKGWIPTKGCDKVMENDVAPRKINDFFLTVPSGSSCMVTTKKYHVDTKSWSRHLDQSNEYDGQRNSSFTSLKSSSFHLPPLNKSSSLVARSDIDLIQSDADDSFEVEPIVKVNNRYNVHRVGCNTIYRSTRTMRVRKERPKAARGARTQPNSMIQY